ncbi:MAG: 2-oxoglutarate dehydrogenase E1 component [Verrucomicrobia bacterium]|nr:2-oxoglutarate dehydrogenase E1 component [Verrucomicrobiota bacterium]
MSENDFSYANLANLPALEQLYQDYLRSPESVEPSWRHFFEGMSFAQSAMPGMPSIERKESPDLRVYLLIDAYRKYGHLMARFNPVSTTAAMEPDQLNIEKLGFKKEELGAHFPTCGFLTQAQAPLKDLIEALKKTYCGTVGIEYMGLGNVEMEKWLQQQIEPFFPLHLDKDQKIQILHNLNRAELFESFLHTKYVGQKRFSLEGGETMIPMLSSIIEQGAEGGVLEVVLGMSHRGRLNVLANILNKSYAHIFREFEDYYTPDLQEGTGDVKYHKGYVGALPTASGKAVAVTLVANPSHLESVNPVVEGIARAKQELKGDKQQRQQIVPILLHGDAAAAGQGVVYETIQLKGLNGYATGGTLHLVVNNQIGFTTLPRDSRSTTYCTDIARGFGAPVFHVNAEDPEGCVRAANLAISLRQKFQCDVFIDLNCYRKYGHNEGDEPTFTQPLEYAVIKSKKTIRELFRDQLIKENVLDSAQAELMENQFKQSLQKALEGIPALSSTNNGPRETQEPIEAIASEIKTAVGAHTLIALAEKFCAVPDDLRIHPKIKRLLDDRLSMVRGDPDKPGIDWGMGEHLAFASLLNEKVHLRLSGQDVRRGTFSHRHAMWVDQVKEQKYFPLSHLSPNQAPFDVFNSPLSEYAVLGFDFGYSIAYPKSLVIWEAQFGDFANGAQIVIDQYIAPGEQKWSLNSNLTLLLPHGYEGQGPEHSSARIERFLQLSGHENMRVANCSTPAQLFHLLRAQAHLPVKKPLVVFTPKALLRHPLCVSSLNDLSQGNFQEVIDDPTNVQKATRLYFCSGKVYYDLFQERQKRGAADIALVRVEQLYPFPEAKVKLILKKYASAGSVCWVQEEHSNMGAWEYIRPYFNELLGAKDAVQYIGRDRSASPAAGSHALHKKQLEQIIQTAFKTGPN